jgi:hypothetical protein
MIASIVLSKMRSRILRVGRGWSFLGAMLYLIEGWKEGVHCAACSSFLHSDDTILFCSFLLRLQSMDRFAQHNTQYGRMRCGHTGKETKGRCDDDSCK